MNNSAGLNFQEPVQKSNHLRWLAGALIVLLILAPSGIYGWRYLYNPCEVEAVEQASAFLNIQLKTYDGVYQVATTASRDAPDHPVTLLQQILMDTQEVAVPTCLQTAKSDWSIIWGRSSWPSSPIGPEKQMQRSFTWSGSLMSSMGISKRN